MSEAIKSHGEIAVGDPERLKPGDEVASMYDDATGKWVAYRARPGDPVIGHALADDGEGCLVQALPGIEECVDKGLSAVNDAIAHCEKYDTVSAEHYLEVLYVLRELVK
jgi:hypothetical protein